jgi:NADPH-dependent ferric siderophore reductase
VVDFAIHAAGPATEWASAAKPGRKLGVGGPRGSFVVTDDFDWYLHDRRRNSPSCHRPPAGRTAWRCTRDRHRHGSRCREEQAFETATRLETRWIHRPLDTASDPAFLLDAVKSLTLPEGDGYIWIAGENDTVKILRKHLVEERGHNRSWIKAAGYWRKGSAGFHENHNEG